MQRPGARRKRRAKKKGPHPTVGALDSGHFRAGQPPGRREPPREGALLRALGALCRLGALLVEGALCRVGALRVAGALCRLGALRVAGALCLLGALLVLLVLLVLGVLCLPGALRVDGVLGRLGVLRAAGGLCCVGALRSAASLGRVGALRASGALLGADALGRLGALLVLGVGDGRLCAAGPPPTLGVVRSARGRTASPGDPVLPRSLEGAARVPDGLTVATVRSPPPIRSDGRAAGRDAGEAVRVTAGVPLRVADGVLPRVAEGVPPRVAAGVTPPRVAVADGGVREIAGLAAGAAEGVSEPERRAAVLTPELPGLSLYVGP